MTRKEVIGELRELKHMFQRSYGKYPTCLEEAIDYIYQTPRWIPVSERLPEAVGIYPVWTAKGFGDHLSTSYWDGESWSLRVVAWMPLPEPYKEVQE